MNTRAITIANFIAVFAVLALGVFFYQYVDARAINVPFHDDILDILDFSMRFSDSEGLWSSLQLLHEQHNDHRTAASRLVYLGSLQAIGEINFRFLALLANAALALLLFGYATQLRESSFRWVLWLLAALLLLQPRAFALLTFPMAAFAFLYLYAYSFLAIICLHRRGWLTFSLAVILAFGANFSIASGQLTWVVGMFVLTYRHWRGIDSSKSRLVFWGVFAVLSLSLFHVGLETPNDILTLLKQFLSNPIHQIHFFFVMLGSVTGFESIFVSTLMGVIYLLLLSVVSFRDWPKEMTPLHWFAWFIVASIAILALGRAFYVNVDYALAPRYSFGSINLLICLLFIVLKQPGIQSFKTILPSVLLAALISISNFSIYTPIFDDHKEHRLKQYNRNKHWIFGYPGAQTNAIVDKAIERGIYLPPAQPLK